METLALILFTANAGLALYFTCRGNGWSAMVCWSGAYFASQLL